MQKLEKYMKMDLIIKISKIFFIIFNFNIILKLIYINLYNYINLF